jgi:hypothetical protein
MANHELDEILSGTVQANLPLCQANWPDDVINIDGAPVEPLPSCSLAEEVGDTETVTLTVPAGFKLGIIWQRLPAEIRARALAGTEKLLEMLFLEKLKESQPMSDEHADLLYGESNPRGQGPSIGS